MGEANCGSEVLFLVANLWLEGNCILTLYEAVKKIVHMHVHILQLQFFFNVNQFLNLLLECKLTLNVQFG